MEEKACFHHLPEMVVIQEFAEIIVQSTLHTIEGAVHESDSDLL